MNPDRLARSDSMSPNRSVTRQREALTDRVYEEIKALVSTLRIPPGVKLSESELATRFGVSRTPVREALNRLFNEGFLSFAPNRGFHCRLLDAKEIFDLYEVRLALETCAVRLAIEHADDQDLDALEEILRQSQAVPEDGPIDAQLDLDEQFHEGIARLSENGELARTLSNINARIRFTRLIDMIEGRRSRTQAEHRRVLQALRGRDSKKATQVIEGHIARRLDQIVLAIGKAYARMNIDGDTEGASDSHPVSTRHTRGVESSKRLTPGVLPNRRSRPKSSTREK